ncbi:hypothetical protein DBV15_00848 [Temnothorax longispinosus]|uniref:Uncharacterized protein n=1 Tax=Temnothorax longispinosus TaxID=300112 RepID=A0A4S2KKG0_9HYME|nr:hypothetical protein DBV15_00848 [Temnothorax longispinosus]
MCSNFATTRRVGGCPSPATVYLRPVSTDRYPISKVICSRRAIVRTVQNVHVSGTFRDTRTRCISSGSRDYQTVPAQLLHPDEISRLRPHKNVWVAVFRALRFFLFPFKSKRVNEVGGIGRDWTCGTQGSIQLNLAAIETRIEGTKISVSHKEVHDAGSGDGGNINRGLGRSKPAKRPESHTVRLNI